MDSDNIKVLPACREDYNDLLELCRKSGLYYSYIDCSLKEWLGFSGKPDPNRYTEIFYLNGKKIGFSSRIIFEDYIFQDMLRIDRAYQRKGFSRISIERGIELARAHNLSKIRMSVDGSKEPALKRAIRFGFSEIGEWTVFVFTRFDFISGKNNIANDIHIAEPGGLPSVLEFIKANSSSFSTKMYARRYSWRPLDEGNLIKEIQDKKLLIKKSNGGIKSFSLYII